MVLRGVGVAALLLVAALAGGANAQQDRAAAIDWRRSLSLGVPEAGRLVRGVRLPAQGEHFFTWDPVKRRQPNRGWRRWGHDRLVRLVLQVLDEFAAAHPKAPRIGVGDLSRSHGGDFGARFGYIGHYSHQNGLDVDVYYPRRDRRERAPTSVRQVDLRLSQELVDRFVRAGAIRVYVGPNTPLRGPSGVVVPAVNHDNHLHVRMPNPPPAHRLTLGRSAGGLPITAVRLGDPTSDRRVLIIGCIRGDACAGRRIARRLVGGSPLIRADLWVIANLNPDGLTLSSRKNARGVDVTRNFGFRWSRARVRERPQPFSEPETRALRRLAYRLQPDVTIWFQQPRKLVRGWGSSIPAARRYARLVGLRFRALRGPTGGAVAWQNRRFPDSASFTVELRPRTLSKAAATRHARAILRLARQLR